MTATSAKNTDTWYLYLIKNKLNQLYTGITKDAERRFQEHASGSPKCAKALKGKGPLVLAFVTKLGDHSTALKAEIWMKKQSRDTKNKIISGEKQIPF
ncbi:GIY-YIG nuclease family protein [Glaciecola sp. MH2013]|uniref:GIY-YIG nuclease family protein n=1 Tax=Glaciecola sp. MH2013 TaxID=2785524 RepID=UPI00189D67A2|nr:GIY-YIG nuclease family protein [Glaciecola sp. MH2013]MBF7072143.1 GIY-YIG nuclease family protein [Glaciecola sp. MH2013]